MIDPRLKILLLLMAGVLAVTLESLEGLAVLAVACGSCLLAAGVPTQWRRRGMAVVVAITWSTVLSQSLFYGDQPRTELLQLGPITFWNEGVTHGLIQSLRFIGVSLGGIALTISTPPDRLLVAMQRLGIPSGLCFLTVTALRFIPTVGREIVGVRQARRLRSARGYNRNPWVLFRQELLLLMPILARSLRRARALAESMHIRGFDPSTPRQSRRPLTWQGSDTVILLASGGLCSALVSAKILFGLYSLDIFYHPGLRGLYGWCRNWL